MRKIWLIILLAGMLLGRPDSVLAAKTRPPRGISAGVGGPTTARPVAAGSGKGVKAIVRFRADRLAILLSFADFGQAVSATYSFTYTTNGIAQGARSTVSAETAGGERELLFGTCSKGVCRYHPNVTNARLVIDSKLSNGVIVRKTFRIKI